MVALFAVKTCPLVPTPSRATVAEAVAYYGYTLECGVFYEREKGNKKINRNPKTIAALMSNLNKASDSLALNGCGDTYTAEEFIGELVETA